MRSNNPMQSVREHLNPIYFPNENKENCGANNFCVKPIDLIYELHEEIAQLKARVTALERMYQLPANEEDKVREVAELPKEEIRPPEDKPRERLSIEKDEADTNEPAIDPDSLKEALTNYMANGSGRRLCKNEVRDVHRTMRLEISNMFCLKALWKKEEECLNKLQAQRGFLHIDEFGKDFGGFLIRLPSSQREYIFIEPCCVRKEIISFNTEEVSYTLLTKLLMNPSAKVESTLDFLVKYSKFLLFCLFDGAHARMAKLLPGQQEAGDKFDAIYNIQEEYFAILKRPLESIVKPIIINNSVKKIGACSEMMTCEIGRSTKKVIHHTIMGLDMLFIPDDALKFAELETRLASIRSGLELEEVTLELLKCGGLQSGVALQDPNTGVWEWRDVKVFREFPYN
eukprot:TRINITY_DN13591_c0_g1_i20.p1 TRINITY_DN13591_c0_g1~~TRINITY_DN13591_c0_g1_i20.p1  ORF type:complete len:400 (+),score=96.62 TRINITY_DN13591_c0_g1_i20:146-1345(+)